MAVVAVGVAVAVGVTAPSGVIVQNAAQRAATSVTSKAAMSVTSKAAMSATPKALRPVANALHAASVQNVVNAMWNNALKVVAARVAAKAVAHVKTATAVDAAKAVMVKRVAPKARPRSTTTPHLKPKPKHAPKHAMNVWPAKSVAKALKAATSHASLALSAAIVVSETKVKAVANAAHAANATRVVVNVPLA
jgi:hypothetical protein